MFHLAKTKRAFGTLLIVTATLITACGKNPQLVDQKLNTSLGNTSDSSSGNNKDDTDSQAVSGWSKESSWIENTYEEYFVNSTGPNHRSYPQCNTNVAVGVLCFVPGSTCQAGSTPSAAAFTCNTNFEVHGRVVDIDSGDGIVGAEVIFHTGGPVNPWEGVKVYSDANGNFSYITNGQPALAMATKANYTNVYDSTDAYARSVVAIGSLTSISMKKAP